MSRTLHWSDEYCPNGHKWIFCAASTLYPDFYYCPAEDKFWEPTVRQIDLKVVAAEYNSDRPVAMRKLALRYKALDDIDSLYKTDELIVLAERKKKI